MFTKPVELPSVVSVYIKAEKEPLAYKDEEFKKAIKSIKIGKTGYVYLIDKEGKLIIHPNKEGVSLINEEFIQKIVSDKKGGLISYYAETTNQNKIVAYRYIPKWDMWVVPGINKGDYLDDVHKDFLYYIVLLGVILIILQIVISLNINRSIKNGIDDFVKYFNEFLSFITFKQNRIEKVISKNNDEFNNDIIWSENELVFITTIFLLFKASTISNSSWFKYLIVVIALNGVFIVEINESSVV